MPKHPSTPRRRRPTIDDVAKLAGVSKGAVSRAVNGGPGISPSTVARILAASDELGWHPSASARALVGARARAIGLVIRRPARLIGEDPFFPNFVAGVEIALSERGYSLVLSVVDEGSEESTYRRLAGERRVDGFVITDLRWRESRYQLLTELGVPTVAVGWPGSDCPFPIIGINDRAGAQRAIEHLVAIGRTRIAHVSGIPGYIHTRARRTAWREGLRRLGLPAGSEVCGEFTAEGGVKATHRLLDAGEPPTAIFFANDLMAIAGISATRDRGLRVPDDIAVIGFDDSSLSENIFPSLTTVSYDIYAWGRRAAELLLRSIAGESVEARTEIPSDLVVRSSTLIRHATRNGGAP